MAYRAPLKDFQFLFDHVVGLGRVAETDLFSEATSDVTAAILTEAGRLCEDVLAPLQRAGDEHGAFLENGVVRCSPGFAEGFRAIGDGGWIGMSASEAIGGMGLPQTVATAVNDMMSSACLSLQLNPLMSQGQIEALENHASDEIKAIYLPKLISGEWCGTMNLTEPQAGSDVGALRSKAEPNGDGSYAVSGQKIFISWGDNDFTENVCHLVLARLPDGGPGTKGISLFMVPRHIPDADGNPGVANSLKVVSLEHKLGLHGSPTAIMAFDGATGWLIGEENAGMKTMFTMMNNARLGVGVQGIGQAEGAYQHALAFAMERKQGRSPIANGTGTIIDHADVRRMLATMKAETYGARAIALACAVAIDMGHATGDGDWKARAAFLTPIAKAFGTDIGCEVAHMGVQVHGGMGFIEETGAAQYSRDVRVTAIYEGTNGIQSMDLVARKLMDGGETAYRLLDEIEADAEAARGELPELAASVWNAAETLRESTEWMLAQDDLNERFAGSVPYLRAFARILGGHYHLKSAIAEGGNGARSRLAEFYISRLLPEHIALLIHVRQGAKALYSLTPDDLASG
ncbi:MAG: acyl-CoA dehydrogenase [Marinosulfonomonas sp.]|nr:MAG: acyl-CoA dehydrogenase [Marinosulfonomonas sp.]